MVHELKSVPILAFLFFVLFGVAASSYYFVTRQAAPAQQTQVERPAVEQFLATGDQAKPHGFKLSDVPSWLFGHVGVIAGLQVLALIVAALKASRPSLTRADRRTVQFLIEIPMYLGLFGTLLGVCLTQFIAGTLVAPLAYFTTMSGILLHVFGKLMIWLPISDGTFEE